MSDTSSAPTSLDANCADVAENFSVVAVTKDGDDDALLLL